MPLIAQKRYSNPTAVGQEATHEPLESSSVSRRSSYKGGRTGTYDSDCRSKAARMVWEQEPLGIWTPSRRIALFAVLALHLVIISVLLKSSRVSQPEMLRTSPIELVYLPPMTTPENRPIPVLPHSLRQEEVPTPAPSIFTLPLPTLPNESAGSPIDWANEANEVAKATSGGSARPLDGRRQSEPNQPSKSIFGERPAYHAGEQFKTDDDQWIVFVSDDCYQIASPFASLNVLGNGLGVQTYCVGKSNTPPGRSV